MNAIESRLAVLEAYTPPLTAPHDLDRFWSGTLESFAGKPLNATRTAAATPFPWMDVYEVTYEGFDDTPVVGWYLLPKMGPREQLPCIIHFHGYSGGKGAPEKYAQWLLMGYAVFAIDVRGQRGRTGNRLDSGHGMARGWISQGILERERSYYLAVAIDCLKAVDWVWEQPEIDRSRLALEGSSQGGGLVLLTAALGDKAAVAAAHVPNMCHMDYGILHSTGSLTELAQFANTFPEHLDDVLETMSYFDIMNLAERIRVPVIVSVGLKDTICMPETIYAACNRLTCEKEIHPYPFMGHEHPDYHNRKAIEFIRRRFGA